jgi:hypothetical protein
VGARILSIAALLPFLPAAPAFPETEELPLEELIQESGFIARVEVLETGPAAAGEDRAGNGYRSLAAELRRLCPRFDHRVTLCVRPATDRFLDAKDLVIEVAIVNAGTEPLRFPNAVSSVLRVKGRLEWARQAAPGGATILFESEDGPRFRTMEKVLEPVLHSLELRPGESCEASLPLFGLFPSSSGRAKLRVWALAGGRISGPVPLSVDFGEGPLLARELRRLKPGESADSGPFRKVGPLDRLLRVAREHALLLGLFSAALLLILLNGRRNAARS